MNRARALEGLGYAGFFGLWFLLFAYWTFPYDRAALQLEGLVKQHAGGYEIEIGELSPYWFSGVEVEDVKVFESANRPAAGEPIPSFILKEGRVRLALLPVLIGNQTVGFDLELDAGELEGKYSQSGEERSIEAELSDIDLAKVSALHALVPLPATGRVTGEVDLTLGADPSKSSGSLEIELKNLVLGDGKAQVTLGPMGGLTIDPIEVGDVNIALDVEEGIGKVEKLSANGKDLVIAGSGEVTLGASLQRTRLDLLVSIKLSESYRNKSDRTKALMALLDSGAAPQLAAARASDGSYSFKIVGSLGAARAVPAANAAGSGAASPGRIRKSRAPKPVSDEP